MDAVDRNEILNKFKKLPDDARKGLSDRIEKIIHTKAEIAKEAEPFTIQIAIENLSNQRNLSIIAGSLAAVAILLLDKELGNSYLHFYGAAVVGLLLSTIFAVASCSSDVESGDKKLNARINEAYAPFDAKLKIIIDLILGKVTPAQADHDENLIRDEMLKSVLVPRSDHFSGMPLLQLISIVLFLASVALLALYFLLRFLPLNLLYTSLLNLWKS